MHNRLRLKIRGVVQQGRRFKFLESRYALREIECAIGYDCRMLEDGRKAVFRHTAVHKRSRRSILERRDLMLVIGASYVSSSAIASSLRISSESAYNVVEDRRTALMKTAFPYLGIDEKDEKDEWENDTSVYDKCFDELDAMEEEGKEAAGESGNGSSVVGHDEGK